MAGEDVAVPMMEAMFEKQSSAQKPFGNHMSWRTFSPAKIVLASAYKT
jgi:hypothetical protein